MQSGLDKFPHPPPKKKNRLKEVIFYLFFLEKRSKFFYFFPHPSISKLFYDDSKLSYSIEKPFKKKGILAIINFVLEILHAWIDNCDTPKGYNHCQSAAHNHINHHKSYLDAHQRRIHSTPPKPHGQHLPHGVCMREMNKKVINFFIIKSYPKFRLVMIF